MLLFDASRSRAIPSNATTVHTLKHIHGSHSSLKTRIKCFVAQVNGFVTLYREVLCMHQLR